MSVVLSLLYGNRTKNALVNISEPLRRATKNPTIVLPSVTQTPSLTHHYLPVKPHRVPLPPVSTPDTYQRVPAQKPTPPKRVQNEFITPKPSSATPPVQKKTTPKLEIKPKSQPHPMIFDIVRSLQ